jgi:hypothetical protein
LICLVELTELLVVCCTLDCDFSFSNLGHEGFVNFCLFPLPNSFNGFISQYYPDYMQQPVNASVLAAVESDPQISPTRRLRIGLLYKHRERAAMLLGHQAEAAITGRAELGLSGSAQLC